MIYWDKFKADLERMLNSGEERTTQEASRMIGGMYASAVKDASLKNGNAVLKFNSSDFADNLTAILDDNIRTGKIATYRNYIRLGKAIVNSWEKSKFDDYPTFEPTVEPNKGVIVEKAGSSVKLAITLFKALTSFDVNKALDGITEAFQSQLNEISGIYSGFEIIENDDGEEERIEHEIPWEGIV